MSNVTLQLRRQFLTGHKLNVLRKHFATLQAVGIENAFDDTIMNTEEKSNAAVLGILGGVGPAAGVLLHEAILNHTENGGTDQGHLDIIHISRSNDICDRTEFLLRNQGENPAVGMARTFKMLLDSTNGLSQRQVVAGIPCNTFHAAPIWQEFVRLANAKDNNVKLLHMLEETLKMIEAIAPHCSKVGLMSTTGTRHSRVYHDLLESKGYQVLEVDDYAQEQLHETIYNTKWGIKSTAPKVTPKASRRFRSYAEALAKAGADVIIMGCTEIPFAFAGCDTVEGAILIDPIVALGRAMIYEADESRLKPFIGQHVIPSQMPEIDLAALQGTSKRRLPIPVLRHLPASSAERRRWLSA